MHIKIKSLSSNPLPPLGREVSADASVRNPVTQLLLRFTASLFLQLISGSPSYVIKSFPTLGCCLRRARATINQICYLLPS